MECVLIICLFCTLFLPVYAFQHQFPLNSSSVFFPDIPIIPPLIDNLSCRSDYKSLLNGFERGVKWAVGIWDASARSPSGWLFGNEAQLGNFDECKSIDAPFPLKFCVGHLTLVNESGSNFEEGTIWSTIVNSRNDRTFVSRGSMLWGLCVPLSCPATDFLLNDTTIRSNYGQIWKMAITEEFCTDFKKERIVSNGEITFWAITTLLLLTNVVSTILHVASGTIGKSSGYGKNLLLTFSFKRNFRKLIAYNPSTSTHPLGIFHGLRFASVVFVLYAHRTGIPISFSTMNHKEWESHLNGIGFKFVAQTDTTVDTFFFMSGVLTSFFGVKMPLNTIAQFLSRIFRLLPAYLWVIFFEAYAIPRLGSGPLWQLVQESESALCAKNWWLSALFLQNYINSAEMCMTHTWYIPCEMHFFLGSLLLMPLIRYKKSLGRLVLIILVVLFTILPGLMVLWKDVDPLVFFYFPDFLENPRRNQTFLEIYVKSHNRAVVYIIGFIFGWYLSTREDNSSKPSLKYSIFWFLLSILLMGLQMAYGVHLYSSSMVPNDIEKSVFAALRRPIWTLGLVCLVLANTNRPIPILSAVLTSRAAVVLGRISFGVYLLHFPIIMANMAKMRQTPVFNWFDVTFSGDLASTCIFATFLYVLLEAPVQSFFTALLSPRSKDKEPTNSQIETT